MKTKLANRLAVACVTFGMLLAAPLPSAQAAKILSYDGSVFPHTRFNESDPETVGALAVVGGVPGTELDDWDGFNLDNTTVANGILSINGGGLESRFRYNLKQHNFVDSIWTNGWQIRARLRMPNARNINNLDSGGAFNPVDHPYRELGGPHYSGYGGGHEWSTHIYISQSGKTDLGRLYKLNFYTDNVGDNDPMINLAQYFHDPITSYEHQGKAGQFFTVDMINAQGRGGAVDVYVDGILVFANLRPTAGLGKPPSYEVSDELFIGDGAGVSGSATLDIDYVELYDGVGGLPGPFAASTSATINPEPSSVCLLVLGTLLLVLSRRRGLASR